MRFFNDFSLLAKPYQVTDQKPDKQYSILPTVLKLVGDPKNKNILDIACGSGFFTLPIAILGAWHVIGVDNSEEQLTIARSRALANTEFRLCDIFKDELPIADIALVPFVANYSENVCVLRELFVRIYQCLNQNGRATFIMDLPEGSFPFKRRRQLGAVKWWTSPNTFGTDGGTIRNDLYDGHEKLLCSLWAYYYTPLTIQFALQDSGFRNICWHKPIVSEDGVRMRGQEFWDGYSDHPELGYITAEK